MSSLTIETEDPHDAYENLQAMLDAVPVDLSQVTSVRLELEYEPTATSDGRPADATASDASDEPVEPSITDAEGGTVDQSGTQSGADELTEAAEQISFRQPDQVETQDDPESIFGDPDDADENDSVFSVTDGNGDAVTFEEPDPAADAGPSGSAQQSGSGSAQRSGSGSAQQSGSGNPQRSATDGPTPGESGDPGTASRQADARRGREDAAPNGEQTPNQGARPGSSGGPAGTDGPSAQTYNKVMRLLQNRDFPIQRSEIEDVAVGAYNVDPDECRAIVDTAIEKGLVAERGSKLVDPTE
ncbi:hypothetical protein [Haloarchaeobius sp. HRN-SO-5]|uniref:hypothetical protein n=1 Tax=Haloarchaeobius sp. HRN-SO-5 TaxID=3446118 RepID=UPI003EBBBA7A